MSEVSKNENTGAVLQEEHKPTFIRSSEDPDAIVVVGGKEFREYRQTLRTWSGYFDAALRSGMKESETMRFEFPHRDPKEWEQVMALTAPFSPTKISKDNVYLALSWFDELCSAHGLQECDKVFCKEVVTPLSLPAIMIYGFFEEHIPERKEGISTTLDALATSFQYRLTQSKACVSRLFDVLLRNSRFC